LADDGKARVSITSRYYGNQFNSRNRYFTELPPEERNRYFQELVAAVSQGARPVGDLVTKFDTYPGLEQFTVEIDRYTVVDGKYLYFDLPFTPSLFAAGSDRRALPLMISRDARRTVRTEIELPPGFRQVGIAPADLKLRGPAGCGQADITTKRSGGKLVLEHQFQTLPAIVEARDYPAMLNMESTLGRKSSRLFLLQAER
jgi:hypothetical protein